MDRNIYVINNEDVEIYYVEIDEDKLIKIQEQIDLWNGKGNLKRESRANLSVYDDYSLVNKKVEIVSKIYIGEKEVYYDCCSVRDTIDMYFFEYYAYVPHPLSKLCDNIINNYKAIELSNHVRELIEWNSYDLKEKKFVAELLSCFKFTKLNMADIMKSNLSVEAKRGLIGKILNFINRKQQVYYNLIYPRNFDEAVNDEIRRQEGFEIGNLERKGFEFTDDEKKEIKKKILSKLPLVQQIEKK